MEATVKRHKYRRYGHLIQILSIIFLLFSIGVNIFFFEKVLYYLSLRKTPISILEFIKENWVVLTPIGWSIIFLILRNIPNPQRSKRKSVESEKHFGYKFLKGIDTRFGRSISLSFFLIFIAIVNLSYSNMQLSKIQSFLLNGKIKKVNLNFSNSLQLESDVYSCLTEKSEHCMHYFFDAILHDAGNYSIINSHQYLYSLNDREISKLMKITQEEYIELPFNFANFKNSYSSRNKKNILNVNAIMSRDDSDAIKVEIELGILDIPQIHSIVLCFFDSEIIRFWTV